MFISVSKIRRSGFALTRILPLLLLVVLVSACKKDDDDDTPADRAKPVIAVATPANGSTVAAGENLRLSLVVTDDRELGELKIEIHDVFDGHGHGKNSAVFSYTKTIALSGQNQTVTENILVPADALAGPYHLIINATDRAGSLADFVEIDFSVSSPSQPVIDRFRVNGMAGDSLSMVFTNDTTATDTIVIDTLAVRLQAEIEDMDGLAEVIVEVHESGHAHKRAEEDEPTYEWEVELAGATTYSLDHTINALRDWLEGEAEAEFELKLLVIDVKGHRTEREFTLHFEAE